MNHSEQRNVSARTRRAALADVQLRGALKNATSLFGERRLEAARESPNWEELRNQARAIKDEVLLHLDRYLEEFVAQCRESRRGGPLGARRR